MAAYWPTAEDEPRIKAYMNALPKLVASRTLTEPAWNNSRATADIAGEVRALKARSEKALYIFGSAELVASLLSESVIDGVQAGASAGDSWPWAAPVRPGRAGAAHAPLGAAGEGWHGHPELHPGLSPPDA